MITPEYVLCKINAIDAELKAALNPRIKRNFCVSLQTCRSSPDQPAGQTTFMVKHHVRQLENPPTKGDRSLEIWLQITTPSNLFMTAQRGKLIRVKAMRCCSEEIFLNAIAEVWRKFDEQPNAMKNTLELEIYQETLQRISLADNPVREKGEPIEVQSGDEVDTVTLE